MVLKLRDDDGIAFSYVQLARALIGKRIGNLIERLGGVFGKGNLIAVRTNEGRDGLPGRLISVIRLFSQLVRAAVDGGVGMENELLLCLPHRQRALGGSPRIQVHQRLIAAHGALQDWELLPNCVYIKSRHKTSSIHRG